LEAKQHLRLIGNDDLTPAQSIAPGSYEVTGETPLEGSPVDLSGYQGTITLDAGTCSGTLTVGIYHRNDLAEEWLEWESFAAVTSANDNQTFTVEYDGGKRYIMPRVTIETDSCNFGISVVKQAPASPEDNWLTNMIQTIREEAEKYQGRSFMTTEWELILDKWSCKNYIEIEKSPIQSVESIKYTDYQGVEHTLDSSKYYLDLDQFWPRICLKYGESWPSDILQESGAIRIAFTAGYTSAELFKQENRNTILWMKACLKACYDDRSLTPADFPHKALEFDRVRGYF
jgi:uncharacterized phiE125 gp8 family phage protein